MKENHEIKRGDIYYADLNPVRGSEQGGVRPVIVLQNDVGNKHSSTTIIAPVTSSHDKAKLPTHVEISGNGLSKHSLVLLEQIQTRDKCRFYNYIGHLDESTMLRIEEAVRISLGMDYVWEVLRNG